MKRCLAVLFASLVMVGICLAQSLTIYTEISPPDQVLGPSGELTGYFVEVVREIQKRAGNADPIEVVPWVRGYREIQTKPNIALFGMARTAERNALFEWVGPIRESTQDFYVRVDSPVAIKTLDDARKLPLIGVYKEDVRDLYLTRNGFTNLDRSLDETIMFKKLMAGRIDALACSSEGYGEVAKLAGFKPEDVRKTMTFLKIQLNVAFSKGTSAAILKGWSSALESMKKDGTFERIFRKYYPNRPLPGPAILP
jgi:polar amino acid transport system substrate-binding protein